MSSMLRDRYKLWKEQMFKFYKIINEYVNGMFKTNVQAVKDKFLVYILFCLCFSRIHTLRFEPFTLLLQIFKAVSDRFGFSEFFIFFICMHSNATKAIISTFSSGTHSSIHR